MKKQTFFCLTLAFLFFTAAANAQTAAKSIYFELGGAGLASFNYDMRFNKREDGLGFKAGIGGFKIDDVGAIFIPLGINYLLGKDQRNYFEVGGGVTIVSIRERYYDFYTGTPTNDKFSTTFGHAYFGYRLQPKNGGFLFRAGITPLFNRDGFFPYWAGISFGYKF